MLKMFVSENWKEIRKIEKSALPPDPVLARVLPSRRLKKCS